MKKFLLILVVCFIAAPVWAAKKAEPVPEKFSMKEVQAGVMSFADSWAALTGQASNFLAQSVNTPESSLHVNQFQLYSRMAVYDIAAGPNPGVAMLDMMVLTSLTRRVWESYWQGLYGDATKPMIKILYELESDIWGFGANILTPRQIEAMGELVDEWWAKHPRVRGANFIRFSDFGELGRKPSIENAVKKGGFLAPIRDAAKTAEDFEELAERALFLSMRMQELVAGRLEISVQEMMQSPDMVQLFDDVHGFRQSAERYAELMETMPAEFKGVTSFALAEFSRERTAAITQILDGVAAERSDTIDQMLLGVAQERAKTLEQTLDGIQKERVALLKAVAQVFYWLELEIEALVIRLFVIFAGLIILWYSLRLVYRYWVDRVANNFIKTVGALILIIVAGVPIVLLGAYLVTRVEPDFSEKADYNEELKMLIDESQGAAG